MGRQRFFFVRTLKGHSTKSSKFSRTATGAIEGRDGSHQERAIGRKREKLDYYDLGQERPKGRTSARCKSCSSGIDPVSENSPTFSIGLAVRNGEHFVGRCIESILSQEFTDLELVVCDNASDDGTITILEHYARADRRLRFSVNQVNIGLHENMRRVLDSSRGTFFRWISADDWLEPKCLSACVRALESRPEAIGVTTWFTIHTPEGLTRYEEYRGEFPNSPDPARRFETYVVVLPCRRREI